MTRRTYTEMSEINGFQQRLEYLTLDKALPGELTFGPLRELNQEFYRSRIWRDVRRAVIARDLGLDLGCAGYPIDGMVYVHHINPLTPKDLYHDYEFAVDMDNLVTVSRPTHMAIHFGFVAPTYPNQRRYPGDTKLW